MVNSYDTGTAYKNNAIRFKSSMRSYEIQDVAS